MVLAQYLTILLNILPLVKSKGKTTIVIIPKKMVQKTVTNTSQEKYNYDISFIPIKSAAESENSIFPSSV